MIPLWARAAESRKRRPVVHDPRALEICDSLDFDFSVFRHAYGSQIGCVIRGLLYDRWVSEFLAQHPGGTIVELGAGLSTRFERVDQGRANWIDVDLPAVIALRRRFFEASPRRTPLALSALDPTLPDRVRRAAAGPYFVVTEGMLMYLAEADVRALLLRLTDAFGPCELAFDSISPAVVRHQRLHDSMRHMMDAPFRWGLADPREIEGWDPRLRVREVATLPDVARQFRDRVRPAHRAVGALVHHALPGLARAYRLTRVALAAR
jgi:O-methyltransferase involved in polyketide biosynthesis